MIEEAQKAQETDTVLKKRGRAERQRRQWSPRRLSAIEIAEGALLADIGVIFQLIIKYLPVGGDAFRLVIPVIFAVIVLRRGLYTGIMSLCVAIFVISIISGPVGTSLLLLEAGAGLFLGAAMKHRLCHFVTVVLGIVCGGSALYVAAMSVALLGGPAAVAILIHGGRQSYHAFVLFVQLLTSFVGLGGWWKYTALPPLDAFAAWSFTYWWISLYLVACAIAIPLVIVTYYVTNVFVRMLGYDVSTFPGGRLDNLRYWLLCKLVNILPEERAGRRGLAHMLRREARRQGLARRKKSL